MRTNADVGHSLYLIPPFSVGWRNFFGELSMVGPYDLVRQQGPL